MDRYQASANVVKHYNQFQSKEIKDYDFLKSVCDYFDKIKSENLRQHDLKFLRHLANMAGVPHYYDLLFSRFSHSDTLTSFDLSTVSSILHEISLHVDEHIKIHRYQKQVLDLFQKGEKNRYFLSASTSFGKTFLIYEIIKKQQYKNIALLFPTIALLSENQEKLIKNEHYSYFKDFALHTLSDVKSLSDKNIFLFTPERYLSFLDKNQDIELDFIFVDEIYKIDNEYESDQENKENERDIAYRIALQDIVKKDVDIFLAGPYIELPSDNITHQSFNLFLRQNGFKKLDYNAYEIVGKKYWLLNKNQTYEIDENFTLSFEPLKGKKSSTIIRNEKLRMLVNTIRKAEENVILYCKQKNNTEKNAHELFTSNVNSLQPELIEFITHLEKKFPLTDNKGQSWIVISALKQKIAIHNGDIPKYIQKEMLYFFNLGYIDVLISTTTITEGVNTSAKNIIVLDHKKGTKMLKTFDAKNIVGRAGRFLYHYSGRIFILDKKFQEILEGSDDPIQHKNYDTNSQKDEIDYFITDDHYLKQEERDKKENILAKLYELGIPEEIISSFKVISYSDKLHIFKTICALTDTDHSNIRGLISFINRPKMSVSYKGMQIILDVISPIIKNNKLKHFINFKGNGTHSVLITMLRSYLEEGFLGNVQYNLTHNGDNINEAIRKASQLIFNIFKYQLVKYLGVFNLMYKYYLASTQNKTFDEVAGIDKLLLKLEYNASSDKGRFASDYGVPNRIVDYYESEESIQIKNAFDDFERKKFNEFEIFLKNNQN